MRKSLIWMVALSVLSFTNAMADCEVEYTSYYRSDGTLGAYARPKDKGNCTGDVVIQDSVTLWGTTYTVDKIPNNAFGDCSGLKSISLPDTITTIESYAFRNSGLEMSDLKLPANLTTIGQSVFVGTNITGSLVIPENVTSIGLNAFNGVTGITDVTLTNKGTTDMSWNAFSNTGKVTINGNITGSSGFQNANITELEIAEGVTTLGKQTFYYTPNLTTIIIPDSLDITTGEWYDGPYQRTNKIFYMSDAKKEQCRQNPFSCGFGWVGPTGGVNFDDLDIRPIPEYTYDSESKLYQSGGLYYQSLSDIINNKPYSPTTQVADGFGHYAVYDKTTGKYLGMVDANGNPWRRRIYTVEEAAAVSKDTGNTIKLRYK